jgi:hypothetical protein
MTMAARIPRLSEDAARTPHPGFLWVLPGHFLGAFKLSSRFIAPVPDVRWIGATAPHDLHASGRS